MREWRGLSANRWGLFASAVHMGLAASLAAVLAVTPVQAQVVQGRVVDAETGGPVAGATVRLIDASGEERSRTAADSVGRYRVSAPEPGRYTVRAEMLGYQTGETEPLLLSDTVSVVDRQVELSPAPIPISGVEVTTDAVNRRLRQFFAIAPAQLRIRPVRSNTIQDYWQRGYDLEGLVIGQNIPNMEVIRSRSGPCFRFRRQGCLPVYLDGARLSGPATDQLPLEMLNTIVILLPSESVAYPAGAVHLFTHGFMR